MHACENEHCATVVAVSEPSLRDEALSSSFINVKGAWFVQLKSHAHNSDNRIKYPSVHKVSSASRDVSE
jgi:hypothetical protein